MGRKISLFRNRAKNKIHKIIKWDEQKIVIKLTETGAV